MTTKLISKSSRATAGLRLAYSAPPQDRTHDEDARRYTLLATKSLAFVKLRANDQPMWRPESYWRVASTGKREMDLRLGRKYAQATLSAMRADRNNHLLADIVQDIISEAKRTSGGQWRNSANAVVRGFLAEISETLAKGQFKTK
jgi:hypothetical protein